jgi:hypothetical protein
MTRIRFLERLRKFALRFELKGLHTGASPWHRLMAFSPSLAKRHWP